MCSYPPFRWRWHRIKKKGPVVKLIDGTNTTIAVSPCWAGASTLNNGTGLDLAWSPIVFFSRMPTLHTLRRNKVVACLRSKHPKTVRMLISWQHKEKKGKVAWNSFVWNQAGCCTGTDFSCCFFRYCGKLWRLYEPPALFFKKKRNLLRAAIVRQKEPALLFLFFLIRVK